MIRISGLLLLTSLLFAACNEETTITPQVRVVGEIPSYTPSMIASTLTPTGSPTPLVIPTSTPTPRPVTVSRLSDDIDPSAARLLEKGQPAPDVVFTDIEGNDYQLDGRVVVLNFWTVGCGSCFHEFPVLQEAHEQFANEDLLILAINVSDLAEETRVLADALGVSYPMVVDPQGEIFATLFGGAVIPTTYFITADGIVHDVVVGPIDTYLLTTKLQELGLN